jgi:shikimate kinase
MEAGEALTDDLSRDTGPGLIFLVGFMGCGKTTLGRKLAARLGCMFMDLDHVFETKEGMSIGAYFTEHGEDKFRKTESELLQTSKYPEHAVVATGGGLPRFFDNMEWMNARGKTIYIKLPAKTLADRLTHEKDERPLLRERHGEALVTFIAEKLEEREPFYNKANIITSGLSLTAEKVEGLLEKF